MLYDNRATVWLENVSRFYIWKNNIRCACLKYGRDII